MKIPAIRGKIGNWQYYLCNFSFRQVHDLVKKIDDELHKSESLRDQIQRSITSNFHDIKNYILTQDERFFNSLVLAVYDGIPKWIEVEMNFGDEYFYDLGVLDFEGNEKIFPVDGQHRVEGIKAALEQQPELEKETVSIILIGHKTTTEGMQRSRRLFSTLNRYARPVKLNDIIALDEDDTVAIITRFLLEEYPLFTGKRVNNAEQKAIPETDKNAFTSLITLYQCNVELLKFYLKEQRNVNPTKPYLTEFLRFRRSEDEINKIKEFILAYWNCMVENINVIQEFLSTEEKPADKFRNSETGGSLLFRPVGILPFVSTTLDIVQRTQHGLAKILLKFNQVNLVLNRSPWAQVLWNVHSNTMIMGSSALVKLLLLYLYDEQLLSKNELVKLKVGYAAKINYNSEEDPALNNVLQIIKM